MKINFLPTKEHYSKLTKDKSVTEYISKVKQLTTELEAIRLSPFLYTIDDLYKETLGFTASLMGLSYEHETREDSLVLKNEQTYQELLDIESMFKDYIELEALLNK
uniref:hypothetical protein n=1 Tax=Shewanella sp. TaxID=50422 RepID=UPI0040476F69